MDIKYINQQIRDHAKALEWPRWRPKFPICIGIRAGESLKFSKKLGSSRLYVHWIDDGIDYFEGHPEACEGLPESKIDGFFICLLSRNKEAVLGPTFPTFCKSNPIFIRYTPYSQQEPNLETYWNF